MANPTAGDAKKPYSTPTLTVYGTVRELTQTVGLRGQPDGGIMPRAGTHI
jgi:hypothetical protein